MAHKKIQHTNTTHKTTNDPQTANTSTNAANFPNLPLTNDTITTQPNHIPPHPITWQPIHNPNEWIYTDGSQKNSQPQLGAAVIHPPTSTITYIDASGQDETFTITRAELAAIHVALKTFKDDS